MTHSTNDQSDGPREPTVREIWVDRGGVRLFALEQGSGPAIVMLHGPMADHRAALPLVAALAGRYRIVTPDLRGSGRSHCAAPLTFEQLSGDLLLLLDSIGEAQAFVGGVSGGSGVALHFALRHPDRTAGLVLIKPVYAGEERGYTDQQKTTFAMMDAIASQALEKGVQVLRPMYANLPTETREKALAMIEEFDAASVVSTSRFLASGAQPFAAADLESVTIPTLLLPGDDPLHPSEVSDFYAARIPNCTRRSPPAIEIATTIGSFVDRVRGSAT